MEIEPFHSMSLGFRNSMWRCLHRNSYNTVRYSTYSTGKYGKSTYYFVLFVLHTYVEYSIPIPKEIMEINGMENGFHVHFPPWNGPLHTFSFLTSMFWRQHVFLGATFTLSWRPSIYSAEYDSMILSLLSFYYCHKNNDNHGRQFSIDSPSMSVMPHKLWVVSFTHASSPFLQGLMDTEFHRAVQQKTTSAINSCPTCQ